MEFLKLVGLCENEKVPVLYPLGYNSPEIKTGVHQNRDPRNNTNQTPGIPNAYPEDEMEKDGIVVGTLNDFIQSNSNVGLYSFNTKYMYWNKLKGDRVSQLLNQMLRSEFINVTDLDELIRLYNFAKLTKNQNNIDIEKKVLTNDEKKHLMYVFVNLKKSPNFIS